MHILSSEQLSETLKSVCVCCVRAWMVNMEGMEGKINHEVVRSIDFLSCLPRVTEPGWGLVASPVPSKIGIGVALTRRRPATAATSCYHS